MIVNLRQALDVRLNLCADDPAMTAAVIDIRKQVEAIKTKDGYRIETDYTEINVQVKDSLYSAGDLHNVPQPRVIRSVMRTLISRHMFYAWRDHIMAEIEKRCPVSIDDIDHEFVGLSLTSTGNFCSLIFGHDYVGTGTGRAFVQYCTWDNRVYFNKARDRDQDMLINDVINYLESTI